MHFRIPASSENKNANSEARTQLSFALCTRSKASQECKKAFTRWSVGPFQIAYTFFHCASTMDWLEEHSPTWFLSAGFLQSTVWPSRRTVLRRFTRADQFISLRTGGQSLLLLQGPTSTITNLACAFDCFSPSRENLPRRRCDVVLANSSMRGFVRARPRCDVGPGFVV